MNNEQHITYNGQPDDGQPDDGERKTENGERATENGQPDDGQRTTGNWKRILSKAFDIFCTVFLWIFGLVVLYVMLLFTVFDTFHVPTESMTPTLHPGDRGIINKLKLGGRVFDPYACAAGEPYEVKRMPGYGKLESGDVIVFNAPFTDSWDSVAMNMRMYYCKRAVAVAGDTLEIRNGHYRVRGLDREFGVKREQDLVGRYIRDYIRETPDSVPMPGWMLCNPQDSTFNWTLADMGPMLIPGKGSQIKLDYHNTILYRKYIAWETGKPVEWRDSNATIGGKPAKGYTFTEDYCFAAGDHAIDSQDSRYWGLLPEKFIVGVTTIFGRLPWE